MNPVLLLLAAALFAWGLGEGMFFFFQPLYLAEFGADPLQIGAILGGAAVAMVLVHIPAGYLADKVGRRPLLRIAWSGGLLATTIMALAHTLPVFVSGLILYNFTAFVISPLNSYVTAARGNLSVGRVLTFISATFSLGMVLGPLLGGWLGDYFGLRSLYIAAMGIFVLSTIFMFSVPAQPIHASVSQFSSRKLLKNKEYLSFLFLLFFIIFALYLPQPLTQNFLQEERGLSLSQIGLLGALGALGNVVLNLVFGQTKTRTGFLLGQFSTALFALFIWKGTGMIPFAIGYFMLGGYRTARSFASAHVNSLIDDAQMGLAYGVTETVIALPQAFAPPLAGYLYTANPASPLPFGLLLIFVGIILTLFFFPRANPNGAKGIG